MKNIFCLLLTITFVTFVSSFPDGAPVSACNTQTPRHGLNNAQTSASPIRIVLSQNRIRPGQTINIRIESISSTFQFRGFMIQPRNVVAPNNLVGTMDTNGEDSQVIDCSGPTTGTHVDRELKTSVSVNWTAPQMTGGIRIHVSVVESFPNFWSGILSEVIDINPSN